MSWRTSAALFSTWLVLILVNGGSAAAPEIKDDGKFFGEEAVKKANQKIGEIFRTSQRDLLIETFESVPLGEAEKVDSMSKKDREKYFDKWAVDRAKDAKVNGVYVLICRAPAHMTVLVTAKARSVFDKEAREKLQKQLLTDFREKRYDEGLLTAVQFVQEHLAAAPATDLIAAPKSYLFCFWNVENLFDDRDDHRENRADKEYDSWFSRDPEALKLKLANLSEALVKLNDGRGPDILAVAEVESQRAAELLRDALNNRLPRSAPPYTHVLMKEVAGGRHISTAILTRLGVDAARTRLHGSRQRILEGHIQVQGKDLTVLATHWTSRVSDEHGERRDKYADLIYKIFRDEHRQNAKVDLLICGDFNDPPDAESVTQHLHATGDIQAILRSGGEPMLLDLMAGKDPAAGYGTHFYNNKWFIFDHIVVSPGLLDREGWSCDPQSVQTVNTLVKRGDIHKRPWRFGNERDRGPRGYSDHFPVTVRLKVN